MNQQTVNNTTTKPLNQNKMTIEYPYTTTTTLDKLVTYDRGMMAATILSAMITQGYATDTIHEEAVKHTDKLIDKLNQTL